MSFSENISEDIPKEILEIRKNIDLINKVFDEERNYEDSFEKDYLAGVYGGIPILKDYSFMEE